MGKKWSFKLPLTDRHIRAIGHVTAQWARLETEINFHLGAMLSQSKVSHVLKEKENPFVWSFPKRVKLSKKLINILFSKDPSAIEDLNHFLDAALEIKPLRDSVAHGLWGVRSPERRNEDVRITNWDFRKQVDYKLLDMPIETMWDIAHCISDINLDFFAFRQEDQTLKQKFPPPKSL